MPDLQIDELRAGQRAVITLIDDSGIHAADALRLREMGFDEGVDVEVLHRAAFGADPIAVRVGTNIVAMRKRFAALVKVSAQ